MAAALWLVIATVLDFVVSTVLNAAMKIDATIDAWNGIAWAGAAQLPTAGNNINDALPTAGNNNNNDDDDDINALPPAGNNNNNDNNNDDDDINTLPTIGNSNKSHHHVFEYWHQHSLLCSLDLLCPTQHL